MNSVFLSYCIEPRVATLAKEKKMKTTPSWRSSQGNGKKRVVRGCTSRQSFNPRCISIAGEQGVKQKNLKEPTGGGNGAVRGKMNWQLLIKMGIVLNFGRGHALCRSTKKKKTEEEIELRREGQRNVKIGLSSMQPFKGKRTRGYSREVRFARSLERGAKSKRGNKKRKVHRYWSKIE